MDNVLLKNGYGKFPSVFSKKEELEIFQRLEKEPQNLKIRNEIILRNLGLVYSAVKKAMARYRTGILTSEDLFAAGFEGLEIAIRRFEWRKGYKFSTYAVWWIKQTIQREVFKRSETIRIPCKLRQDVISYRKAKSDIISSSKRTLTKEEIDERLNLKKNEILNIQRAERQIISLESEFSKKQKGRKKADMLIDFLQFGKKNPVHSIVEKKILAENILKIISSVLKKREQLIIKERFGFSGNGEARTLQKVADKLGITRERVRQIQNKALKKLKKEFKAKGLQVYLN